MGFFVVNPDQTLGPTETVGAADSTDGAIPTFSGSTGKLLQSPDLFFIDPTAKSLNILAADRGYLASSNITVLDAEKTWRSGLGGSTDIRGHFYNQNNAGNRSVRLGSVTNTGSAQGLTFFNTGSSTDVLIVNTLSGIFSSSPPPGMVVNNQGSSTEDVGIWTIGPSSLAVQASHTFFKGGNVAHLNLENDADKKPHITLYGGIQTEEAEVFISQDYCKRGDDDFSSHPTGKSFYILGSNKITGSTAGTGGDVGMTGGSSIHDDGGWVRLNGGAALGGVSDGGSIEITPGAGFGGGATGLFRVLGNSRLIAQSSDEILARMISSTTTGTVRQHFANSDLTQHFELAGAFGAGTERLAFQRLQGGVGRTLGFVDMDGDWTIGSIAGNLLTIIGSATLSVDLEIDGDLNHDGTEVGFYGSTPVVQAAAIADASGGAIIDAEARTALNSLLTAMRNLGLIDT